MAWRFGWLPCLAWFEDGEVLFFAGGVVGGVAWLAGAGDVDGFECPGADVEGFCFDVEGAWDGVPGLTVIEAVPARIGHGGFDGVGTAMCVAVGGRCFCLPYVCSGGQHLAWGAGGAGVAVPVCIPPLLRCEFHGDWFVEDLHGFTNHTVGTCLLYTSDAADEVRRV